MIITRSALADMFMTPGVESLNNLWAPIIRPQIIPLPFHSLCLGLFSLFGLLLLDGDDTSFLLWVLSFFIANRRVFRALGARGDGIMGLK